MRPSRTNNNRAVGEITRGNFLDFYPRDHPSMKPLYELAEKLDGIIWED